MSDGINDAQIGLGMIPTICDNDKNFVDKILNKYNYM